MHKTMKRILILLAVQVLICVHAENTIQPKSIERQGKDLHHYHYGNDDFKSEYPILTSTSYVREDCAPNSVSTFIGRGLNYLLLKIGAVAIVKAILAALLLVKVPIFFLKMAFLKTFLFPVLIAPLLMHYFAQQQTMEMDSKPEAQPSEPTGDMRRSSIDDQLSARIWRSMKTFAESEQCVERVACIFGAYNKDSGVTFSRALKLFEQSSPVAVQQRLSSIREAFKSGVRNGLCSERDFICHGPELFIKQGNDKLQLF